MVTFKVYYVTVIVFSTLTVYAPTDRSAKNWAACAWKINATIEAKLKIVFAGLHLPADSCYGSGGAGRGKRG